MMIMANSSFMIISVLLSLLHLASPSPSLKSFNVVKFGAKGDGKTDSTQAFLRAWEAACGFSGYVQIYVPHGRYVLRPLIFRGIHCKTSTILFRIDGSIVAPDNYYELAKSNSWIVFHLVNGLHIKGGVLDAKGKSLWDCKLGHGKCPMGAQSLSFDNSKNIVVEGLTSINSQMFHITLNACQNVRMVGLTILAPDESPNTDGIHMERSSQVTITNSDFQTGDDCISMGPDNQNVWIEHIHCGPGHGISIGSLGREGDQGALVENVTVKSVTFTGTMNGLRIKTWAKPTRGRVQNVNFLDARMNNVLNPIIIDQNYCPSGSCPAGQASGIQISDVTYKGIHGTSASPVALIFDCSPMHPCKGLTLQDINLSAQKTSPRSECNHAYGRTIGSVQPSSCLR
ncbi:hypothetical protein Cgig2_032872 [Carnegiea gigantea]|uniref:Polygalacturonase n=1 Tax=Carnegiea gigantea TaxID=171969 RepID=A0A9Q1GXL8_9CARY|nr:hypothetical protein Cgig2_018862 [Carnegiea gigantea]KAJ8427044.1 hypothetical protein Cgig2_032872 [Carnegiea gigantea]